MSWLDAVAPPRMRRVAIVAPERALTSVLTRVADAGAVELGPADGSQAGKYDGMPPQAQVEAYAATAIRRSGAAALAGWVPARLLPGVAASLAGAGGAVVPLAYPPGVDPPTVVASDRVSGLVTTYGVVPYADVDPGWLAWGSYVLMFGMMFGDAGEGFMLLLAAVALRAGLIRRFRAAWPFVAGAGVASIFFGLLYGECFGPTGLVPVIWLSPLSHAITLLLVAAGTGAALLAGAYALGAVNRWREGGWAAALYAPSGIAGSCLFAGVGVLAAGLRFRLAPLPAIGGALAVAGLALAFAGFIATAGGGGAGLVQATVESFDLAVRLGSNVVSFTRLAAFGLTHAALGWLVWDGSRALWHHGGAWMLLASLAFAVGTALVFGLEALVAAVQALRLEYYELFSRVFVSAGRQFRPWHVPGISAYEEEST